MSKAILLSIHKKHNENIESGAKLLELRKSIPKDLKIESPPQSYQHVYVKE